MGFGLVNIEPEGIGQILTGGAAALNAGTNLYGTVKNYKLQKEAFEHQKDVDKRNFANQDREFAEQAFLNRNSQQLQASDALKAGINPIAASIGGALTSASASNVSSNAEAPQLNLQGTMESFMKLAQFKHEEKMQQQDIKAQQELQDDQQEHEDEQAEKTRTGQWERLVEEQNNLNARNEANIKSAEKIAREEVGIRRAQIVAEILKNNEEARQEYNRTKADVLQKAYEYLFTTENVTPSKFESWLGKMFGNSVKATNNFEEYQREHKKDWFNFLKGEGEKVDTSDYKSNTLFMERFSEWFDKNFDFAPFTPVNVDEFIEKYSK